MAATEADMTDLENGNADIWLKPRADTGVAWCMRFLLIFAILVIIGELSILIYLGVLNVKVLFKPDNNPIVSKPFGWTGNRLPVNISTSNMDETRIQYAMTITISENLGTFSGSGQIDFVTLGALNGLVLNAKDLVVSKATLISVVSGSVVETASSSISYDPVMEYVFITWPSMIPKGSVSVGLEWTGRISNSTEGLYRSVHVDASSGSSTTILATQFEPNYARRVFPCFDEPNYKAFWTLNLVVPTSFSNNALSNMPLSSTPVLNTNGDSLIFSFTKTKTAIAPYLVAFVVGNMEKIESSWMSDGSAKTIRVWAQPSQLPLAQFALDSAVKFLQFYETYTSTPFAFPKMDMVAIPDFAAGAMENYGLITYRESALLVDHPTEPSFNSMMRVAEVVAHELAHQWFGNVLTPEWWDHLWIAEGSATYFSYLAVDDAFPSWQYLKNFFHGEERDPALNADELLATHALQANITSIVGAREIFDTTTYSKGAAIIRHVSDIIGKDNLRSSISQYFRVNPQGSSMNSTMFLRTITSTNAGIGELLFNYSTIPSFPMLLFANEAETGRLLATQMSYGEFYNMNDSQILPAPVPVAAPSNITNPNMTNPNSTTPQAPSPTWYMPVNVVVSSGSVFNPVFTFNAATQTSPVSFPTLPWYKANPDASHYYRVQYPQSNWNNLIAAIARNDSKLTPIDRASLISDAFTWAEINKLSYNTVFNLTSTTLTWNQTNYVVWKAALTELSALEKLLHHKSCYGNFQLFLNSLLVPAFHYWTWDINKINTTRDGGVTWEIVDVNPTAADVSLRNLILSFAAEHDTDPDFVNYALSAVNTYLESTSNTLPVDTQAVLFKTAVINGDFKLWERLLARYQVTANPSEKDRILSALAFTRLDYKARHLLSLLLEPSSIIRAQDHMTVLRSLAANRHGGIDMIWGFFQENAVQIIQQFPQNLGQWVSTLAGFSDMYHYNNIKDFFYVKNPSLGLQDSVAAVLEVIYDNNEWLDEHAPADRKSVV